MKHAAIALLCAALGACAVPARIERSLDADSATAEKHVADTRATIHNNELYRVSDVPALTGAPVQLQPVDNGPPVLSQTFTYSALHDTLSDAAAYLSDVSKVQIRVSPDATEHAAAVRPAAGTGEIAGAWGGSVTGSLRSILNQITASTGTSWRWTGRNILIYHLDTRVFTLAIVPPTINSKASVENKDKTGGGGAAGSSGGSSGAGQGSGGQQSGGSIDTSTEAGQKLEATYKFNPLVDSATAVKAMLSKDGTVAYSESSGSLVVRDTAAVLDSVQQYVDDLNGKFSQPIDIEMTLMTVETSDSNAMGLDWNLVRQAAGGTMRFGLTGASDAPSDSFSVGATVVSPTSPFSGSQLLVNAIAKTGRTTSQRNATIKALNYQPSHVQSVSEDTFIINQTTVIVPQAGSITTPTTLTKTTGLSLTLLPVLLADSSILIDVQGSLSAPRGVRRVPGGNGVTLEFPQTLKDDVIQRARLQVGETLVLTTLDQGDASADQRGVGNASFFGLGGGRNHSTAHRTLVILLTPHVARQ